MIRLAVRCAPEAAERVLAELVQLVPDGVEEEHGETYVEYAIYGPPGELPELPDLRAAAGDGLVEIETTEIPDDWADAWRDFHRPVVVANRLIVRPSWVEGDEQPSAARNAVEIVIDPGRAFGTGAHQTTRLCLELLLGFADEGARLGPLADWGTGSGVLAIAAVKLGFGPVNACDSESAALEAAASNAALNDVEIEFSRRNLREQSAPWAPTVTANLTAPVLREVAKRIEQPPARLLCSGMLHAEVDGVVEVFSAHGLSEHRRVHEGEWAACLLAS